VAATNRDLLQRVEEGLFRFDLYQRLSVFPIHLPPLRDRGQDVLILADHFVKVFAQKLGVEAFLLPKEVQDRLMAYEFPGNVRELKNVLERASIMAAGGKIELHHLPERLLRSDSAHFLSSRSGIALGFVPGVDTLESLERRLIVQALEHANGVKSEAARLLGISRFQLTRRLEKFRLVQPDSNE
jgi:transcriptional regulator with GAF, ATPase, and Fis domain